MFNFVDMDSDGTITLEEFIKARFFHAESY